MPVTLRDQFGVAADDGTANQIAEQARADTMWAPTRGYQAGRITTDLNAALVDEAAARAANNEAAAQEAVARQQALQRRQQMYAPSVGRVEDIRSLSDAASWAGTQMGQGVASMQDPLALAAVGQAVGTVGRFVPGLRGVSALAPVAGAVGAFGLNQRQMAGEFYGNLKQDPAALARLTPQEANLLAQGVGAAGGALDTIVPGLAGRALGGAALHQAAGRAASSLGGHVLRHNALEGATEVGQGEIGRQALNYLNPGRDTGGDWSDRLNEFAGAAVGATPVTAAGGLANRGYGRVGGVANAVKDKAGAVVDMASNGLQTASEAAKTVAEKTGLKGVVDMGVRKGKDAWERVGEGGLQEAAAQARERVQKFRLSAEEADVLTGRPPPDLDEAGMNQWFADNDAKRGEYVFPRLEQMAVDGHPDAERLLTALESDDPKVQADALDQASNLLMSQNEYAQSLERAAEFKAGMDSRIKGASALAARGVKAVGKAAFGTAKNVAQGVAQGFQEGSKKNLQGAATLDYDTWRAWRDENAPTPSSEPGSTHAIQRAVLGRQALKELRGEVPAKADPAAVERSRQRATLFAELLAAEAKNRQTRQLAHRVDESAEGVTDYSDYVRSLGYELADMAESWAGRQGRQPTGGEAGQFDVATALIDSMAGDLRAVMGDGAGDAVQTMAAGADPAVQPFLEYLGERVDGWQGERQTRAQADTSAQNAMLAMLPQAQQAELLADDRQGARQLQRTVEMIARGRMPPDQRAELERALGGKQVVLDMLQLVRPEGRERNVVDDTATGAETANADRLSMNDDGEVSTDPQAGAFEQRQAERKLGKSAGPTMYMFEGQKSHTIQTTDSTRRDARNPFDSATELTAIQRAKIDEDAKALGFTRNDLAGTPLPSKPRPRLVEADNVDDARAKLGGKIAQFEANLKNSSPQHIDVVSAKEVLDGMNMQPAARLALFRDYMFQNARRKARSEQNPDPVGAAEDVRMAIQAHALVVESMRSQPGRQSLTSADLTDGGRSIEGWIKKNLGPEAYTQFVRGRVATIRASEGRPTRTYGKEQAPSAGVTEAERALVQGAADQFFANHYLVRAQEMTDRVPGTIAAGELIELAKAGERKRSAVEGEIRLAADGADRNDQRDAMEGQLLNFAQPKGANLLGGKDTTLSIPADALVGWVRKNRRQEADTEDKRNVNRRFMDDLFEGIATLADSGMTEGMPWVNGPNGEKQVFGDVKRTKPGKGPGPMSYDALPANLRLPTTTGKNANWGRQQRTEEAAKKPNPEPANRQERRRKVDVAREQARDEWFAADPLIAATDNVTYREGREAHDVAVADYADRGGAVLSERAVGEGRTTRAGERLVSTPVAETTSASSNAVLPLDTKIGRREGGLDNALEESLYSRRALNMPAFESRNSKPALVADRAAGIIDKLRSEVVNQDGTRTPAKQDVAGALADIRARLNTAARKGQEGGIQYAFPLAQVLNPDVLGMADLSMEQSRALLAMRSELSALLADSKDLKPYERTQLVKQMAGKAHAGKVNVTNAQRLLEKGAQAHRDKLAEAARAEAEKQAKIDVKQTKTAAPEVAAAAAPKSQPAPAGARLTGSSPYLAKDQRKADKATKFIGRGSARSSTAQYAKDFGARANSGQYTAADTVFVSAEGARAGRLDPDFGELGRALAARATIITDAPADRARSYNVGERQVAEFLAASGYEEKRAGEWSPKSIPPRPTSAIAKAAAFRKERQALTSGKAQESRVDTLAGRIANMALDAQAGEALRVRNDAMPALGILRRAGLDMAQALASPKLQAAYAKLGALRLQGSQAAAAAMLSIQYAAEQHYALPVSAQVEAASHAVIAKDGATLRQALEPVVRAKGAAPLASILAQAVVKVAGDTAIRHDSSMSLGSHGEYSPTGGGIRINPVIGSVATVVHEGAHAATVAAMIRNEGLHRAVYDLMDHVLAQDPKLAGAYGMTNSLEFLAEGLSNQHFQERLKQIKASDGVRKYLGETVANAWDAFVGLVRQALGLAPEHESALSQFLELSGRAMRGTASANKGASLNGIEYRPVVSLKDFTQRVDALLAAPEVAEMPASERAGLRQDLLDIADERGAPFPAALGVAAVHRTLPALKQSGRITAERIMDTVAGMGFGQGALSLPSEVGRKLNAQGGIRRALYTRQNDDGRWSLHDDLTGEGISIGHPLEDEFRGDFASKADAEAALRDYVQGKYSRQHVTNRPVASDADIKAAKDYVDKVLGPKVKAEFAAISGYSGEWIAAQDLIKVSTLTNAGVLNVARHEALHAFFGKFVKANPKAMRVLNSLTDDPRVLRRLQRLLKDEPAALAQLTDGEERLAYIHQFAMAGLLKLPHTPGTTLMSKIRKALRRVFQMVSDQERAVDLLYSFERGDFRGLEPSAAGRVIAKSIDQGSWASAGAKKFDGVMQRAAALALPANTILANSASPTARKLAKLFYTNPGEEAAGKEAEGYLNARNRVMRRYDNHFRATVEELDDGQRLELINAMQNETATDKIADPEVALAKEKLHALFARFHRYMTDEKGLAIGKINENYFPVVWNPDEVGGDKFKQLLMGKYQPRMQQMADAINAANAKRREKVDPVSVTDVVDAVAAHIARENPLDEADMNPLRQDGVLAPWFASGHKRVLNFISPEDRAPFLEKNIVSTLSRYVRQGVRTAEYSSRFGRQGAKLHAMLNETKEELESASQTMLKEGTFKDEKARADWVRRQYRDVANATGAMEGSLGHDVSETVRKLNSWAIVYQNVRLLPLALFSSVVDPLGIAARGGDLRAAFETFARGMKAVAQQWGDMIREQPAERQKDQWEKLAEHAGVIDGAIFSHLLADEYGSTYHDNTARRVNEAMFKANGMEPWNRAMRIGATRSAVRFIERHAKLPEEHSARWMAELGLDPRALPMDSEGHLITDKRVLMSENPDMENDAAEAAIDRVHAALVRWVEGAILSPNAAQRPAWGSDPHYSMFFHLKQFSYSFHETLIKRAVNEAKHGNVLPLGMFAWYIPAMIAADVTKGLMLGAGELPNYMKGYDLGDWMLHGVNRAGVLGYAGLAGDTAMNPLSVAGPMAEQAWDAIMDPVERTLVRAMPANALYSRALL